MDDPFGYALMVEMLDLIAQDEILKEGGPPRIGPQGVLVVRYHEALVRGQGRVFAASDLVKFSAGGDL